MVEHRYGSDLLRHRLLKLMESQERKIETNTNKYVKYFHQHI